MNYLVGIGATTHLDRHHQRFTRSALEDGAAQIREHFIPFLFNHDAEQQIGVVLSATVEQMSDGEFALLLVIGIFESEEDGKQYFCGERNTVWEEYLPYLDGVLKDFESQKASQKEIIEPTQKAPANVADYLGIHLDSTAIWVDGSVYTVKHFIANVNDLEIHVHRDHNPPHFHVRSRQRGIDARFSVDTLRLINVKEGAIRPRDVKKIQDFFRRYPNKLKELRDEHGRMQH